MKYLLNLFVTSLIIYPLLLSAKGKIQIRPSLGWAKGYNSHNYIYSSDNSPYYSLQFNKVYYTSKIDKVIDRLSNIQHGIMIEYLINKNHTIGFGYMSGSTESKMTTYINDPSSRIFYYTSGIKGTYIKQGIEYTFNMNLGALTTSKSLLLNKLNIGFVAGIFNVNNQISDYSSSTIHIVKDSLNKTKDSLSSPSYTINNNGFMFSGGLRLAYLSKKKKEKISITLLYDYGLTNLVCFESKVYYNYLNSYIAGKQISRGSQIKIYVSIPIRIYDFDKQKFRKEKR